MSLSRIICHNLSNYRKIVLIQQHSFRTCSIQFKSKDYYKILGVSKHSSDTDVKKAYVELAKNYHPDVNNDDPKANEKFQEITKAYEYILYENKRNWLSLHQNKTSLIGHIVCISKAQKLMWNSCLEMLGYKIQHDKVNLT